MTGDAKARHHRINNEMLDSLDEELELEIDDDRLAKALDAFAEHPRPTRFPVKSTSRNYFVCKANR